MANYHKFGNFSKSNRSIQDILRDGNNFRRGLQLQSERKRQLTSQLSQTQGTTQSDFSHKNAISSQESNNKQRSLAEDHPSQSMSLSQPSDGFSQLQGVSSGFQHLHQHSRNEAYANPCNITEHVVAGQRHAELIERMETSNNLILEQLAQMQKCLEQIAHEISSASTAQKDGSEKVAAGIDRMQSQMHVDAEGLEQAIKSLIQQALTPATTTHETATQTSPSVVGQAEQHTNQPHILESDDVVTASMRHQQRSTATVPTSAASVPNHATRAKPKKKTKAKAAGACATKRKKRATEKLLKTPKKPKGTTAHYSVPEVTPARKMTRKTSSRYRKDESASSDGIAVEQFLHAKKKRKTSQKAFVYEIAPKHLDLFAENSCCFDDAREKQTEGTKAESSESSDHSMDSKDHEIIVDDAAETPTAVSTTPATLEIAQQLLTITSPPPPETESTEATNLLIVPQQPPLLPQSPAFIPPLMPTRPLPFPFPLPVNPQLALLLLQQLQSDTSNTLC